MDELPLAWLACVAIFLSFSFHMHPESVGKDSFQSQ